MRIDSSESLRSNISSNNSIGHSSAIEKKSGATGLDQANLSQTDSRERSFQSTKPISRINEYDKDNMPVSERVVIEAIQKANKAILGGNRRFEFSIHDQTNEIVVKVYNSETDELIREIPNEKILDMVAKICEMAGLFVDERR
jgi:flagellar protein FlaG